MFCQSYWLLSHKKKHCKTDIYIEAANPYSPIAQDLRTGRDVDCSIPGSTYLFSRTDDSHCHRIHSSLTTDFCFDDDEYVGKQPAAWKEDCAEYW